MSECVCARVDQAEAVPAARGSRFGFGADVTDICQVGPGECVMHTCQNSSLSFPRVTDGALQHRHAPTPGAHVSVDSSCVLLYLESVGLSA